MTFGWGDYLALARRLVSGDEASQRTAISRAYYAAFHTARRHVAATRPEVRLPRHGAVHDVVWQALQEGTREERSAAIHGNRLRRKRMHADYELIGLVLPADARHSIEAAEQVVRLLAGLRGQS